MRFGWFLAAILWLFASASQAQIRLTAGEHAGFTRVVLRTEPGLQWTLIPDGADRIFAPAIPQTFDIDDLFLRIPRSRLSEARPEPGQLRLVLACDCPVTAWEERPGLVVLDIADPPSPAPPQETAPTPEPAPTPDPAATARQAGETLARQMAPFSRIDPSPGPETLDQITGSVSMSLARALAQGLLEPALLDAPPQVTLPAAPVSEAPLPNLRLQDATERSDPAEPTGLEPQSRCGEARVLDEVLLTEVDDFMDQRATLMQSLFEEFDQPADRAHTDLAYLYLASGFGAEARALLENLTTPLAGKDLLIGFADVLEGRMSNSRLRLAQIAPCEGAAALASILAGAPTAAARDSAAEAALAFSRLTPALRALLGADLASRLVEAGAAESARIVGAEILRSPWSSAEDRAIVEAILPGPRPGASAQVGNDAALRSPQAMLAWLERALAGDVPVSHETLEEARALAEQHGANPEGAAILERVARLWLRSATPAEALTVLDRIDPTGSTEASSKAALRDELWLALTDLAEDRDFLTLVLERSDWRDGSLSDGTRSALAARLADLGLTEAAAELTGAVGAPAPDFAQADTPAASEAAPPLAPGVLDLADITSAGQAFAGPVTRAANALGESERLRATIRETLGSP